MLSVVLPNFNHSRFLPAALDALAAQTRPVDELIVIDDASTDESVAVITAHLSQFTNARLIRNEKNLGVVRNMNIGLKLAGGDLIAFAAADDVTAPRFFERGCALLDAFPQAAFASGQTDIIDADGVRVGALASSSPLDHPGYIDPQSAATFLLHDDAWFTGNATLFRRKLLLDEGGFPEELSGFTDGYVSRVLAVKYGACYAPEAFGAWRRLPTGLAWSQTEDMNWVARMADLGVEKMRKSGAPFHPDYPGRWKGRYFFGAKRFALVNRRKRAKAKGFLPFVLAGMQEVVWTIGLFLWFRPRDFLAVLRRRLTRMS